LLIMRTEIKKNCSTLGFRGSCPSDRRRECQKSLTRIAGRNLLSQPRGDPKTSGFGRLRLGGRSFGGSLLFLFGLLGFPARPLLFLVRHDALPSL
jgi:hypothetical protein